MKTLYFAIEEKFKQLHTFYFYRLHDWNRSCIQSCVSKKCKLHVSQQCNVNERMSTDRKRRWKMYRTWLKRNQLEVSAEMTTGSYKCNKNRRSFWEIATIKWGRCGATTKCVILNKYGIQSLQLSFRILSLQLYIRG